MACSGLIAIRCNIVATVSRTFFCRVPLLYHTLKNQDVDVCWPNPVARPHTTPLCSAAFGLPVRARGDAEREQEAQAAARHSPVQAPVEAMNPLDRGAADSNGTPMRRGEHGFWDTGRNALVRSDRFADDESKATVGGARWRIGKQSRRHEAVVTPGTRRPFQPWRQSEPLPARQPVVAGSERSQQAEALLRARETASGACGDPRQTTHNSKSPEIPEPHRDISPF